MHNTVLKQSSLCQHRSYLTSSVETDDAAASARVVTDKQINTMQQAKRSALGLVWAVGNREPETSQAQLFYE